MAARSRSARSARRRRAATPAAPTRTCGASLVRRECTTPEREGSAGRPAGLQANEEPAGEDEPAITRLYTDPFVRGIAGDLEERDHRCASGSFYEAAVVSVNRTEAVAEAVAPRLTHGAVVHAALDSGREASVVP